MLSMEILPQNDTPFDAHIKAFRRRKTQQRVFAIFANHPMYFFRRKSTLIR
jgi:hypothetical protein